jgi:hypothetical protein
VYTERNTTFFQEDKTMMNIFEKTYAQVQEAKRAYNEASDEAGKETARAIYKEATENIEKLGGTACRIWREYETSRDSGNTYIDINEVVWDKDVEGLISCMRENGIDHFTFSSGWSSAVETAWLFQQNGCTLESLIEINSHHKDLFTGEFEKAHGYLFKIQ